MLKYLFCITTVKDKMKHKKFDEVYPYTYYIQHKESGKKYYGVRTGNVSLDISPTQDFSVHYFSSGKFRNDFKNNPRDYVFRVCWTFDTIQEATIHEEKVLRKVYKREDWVNNSVAGLINFTEEIRNKMRLARFNITETGETVAEVQRRKVIESKYRVVDELGTTLGEAAARKSAETMRNTFDEHGNNILVQKARKAVNTRKETIVENGKTIEEISIEKMKKTVDTPDETGTTYRQRFCKKNPACQKGSETSKLISKKRNDRFNEKLANMSDIEFDEFVKGKSELWVNLTRKRREKAIKKQVSTNETH